MSPEQRRDYLRAVGAEGGVLDRLLRAHIKRYGTTPDGRVFQTARGGILQDSAYNEVWTEARKQALTPPRTGRRSAAAPTTLPVGRSV